MTELERVVDQVKRSYRSEAWHGPSVCEVLAGVDAARAAARQPWATHTIWELALHLRATMEILLGRIAGTVGLVDDDAYWPPMGETTEAAWQTLLADLTARHEALVAALTSFDARGLEEPLFAGGSSAYNNFLGHAQHNAYHGGQIALLARESATG